MDANTDTGSFNDVATWLAPFKKIAQGTNCAIVFVRHRRKGSKNDNQLHSGLGSMAQVALFRTELSVTGAGAKRWLKRTKGNIGAPPDDLEYLIQPVPDSDLGQLRWTGAKAAGVAPSQTRSKLGAAKKWLLAQLTPGTRPAAALIRRGGKAGFSLKTLRRAKKELGVASVPDGKGGWNWTGPEQDDKDD